MKSRWTDYEHLVRLAAVFGACLLGFAVIQAVMVPEGFGRYGHYRPGALDANRARAPVFAGEATCMDCHDPVVALRAGNQHRNVRCEACHGPLAQHSTGQAAATRPDARELCARCHAARAARPAAFPQVNVTDHAGAESCASCHPAHAPRIG